MDKIPETGLIFSVQCYAVVVCLSIGPSVRHMPGGHRHCTKTATRRITQTTPYNSSWTRFLVPKISAKFRRGHPYMGTK